MVACVGCEYKQRIVCCLLCLPEHSQGRYVLHIAATHNHCLPESSAVACCAVGCACLSTARADMCCTLLPRTTTACLTVFPHCPLAVLLLPHLLLCAQRTCWCPRMPSRLPTLGWPGRYARARHTQTTCRRAGEPAPAILPPSLVVSCICSWSNRLIHTCNFVWADDCVIGGSSVWQQ
jgi:hypothetical protein